MKSNVSISQEDTQSKFGATTGNMLQPANISRSDTVICLIGDTQNILLNKHEILAIKRGLINAAQVTGGYTKKQFTEMGNFNE